MKKTGPNDPDDLQQLSGIGPAVIRKLHASGIYKFSQIANPSTKEKKALKKFESRGAFKEWNDEAKQILKSYKH